MPSKQSGYCSLICFFVLMILIFFGVSSQGIMGLVVAILDSEFGWTSSTPCCCCVDVDCVCISFLGYLAALDMRVALGGRYSSLGFTSRSCNWKTVSHDRRTLPSSFVM